MKVLLFLVLSFSILQMAFAEPWLSNRFAQNCAGCHAPGRLNRKQMKRRCTLSCQGCHVNPNGGGLRSSYGKWNSNRWLRSFYSDLAWSKKSVHPVTKQKYYYSKVGRRLKRKIQKNPKLIAKKVAKGVVLREFPGVVKSERSYDRRTENEKTFSESGLEEMYLIPRQDPYRIERDFAFTVGADYRHFYWIHDRTTTTATTSTSVNSNDFFPMGMDFGLRIRPIKENVSFVYEARAGNFKKGDLEHLFAGTATTRSAYLLVDDLPYNTYAQYGVYRPMFGYYTPDHASLISKISGLGQFNTFQGLGVGAAPNVPFIVINYLRGTNSSNPYVGNDVGPVITAGLRFVKRGASIQASYWSTEVADKTTKAPVSSKTMYDLNFGAQFDKFTVNGDWLRVEKTTGLGSTPSVNGGDVFTLETRYNFWKQFYGYVMYSTANVARNLGEGSAFEYSLGAHAFLLSGVEVSALYSIKEESRVNGSGMDTTADNYIQLQGHFYF